MNKIIAKSDAEIKSDVLAELIFEPSVKIADIGVLVKDGVVTLNGYATNYGEKWNAVLAAKRVAGVIAVADDIELKMTDSHHRTDGDIAATAVKQINLSVTIPPGAAQVTVREGWVTLDGEVEWWYQKNAAENAVQYLAGVKGVINLIAIKPKLEPVAVETAIKSAFERSALLDAKLIQVETAGNKVVLRGKVRNHHEREEAERAAWAASGVSSVDNQIKIEWSWGFSE